ncbi:MAG: 50S ribosomal protein L28 [Planctomycetota bacterium]
MSRVCEFCGKKTQFGNQVARRGLPKWKGGVGLKTTGITRRTYKPNIQRVRAQVGGSVRRIKLCTDCLKSGRIVKPGKARHAAPKSP